MTSFVEGMERKEKEELLGSRNSKLQTQLPSHITNPSTPPFSHLQHFHLSKSDVDTRLAQLSFREPNLPSWPQLGPTGRIKSKTASRCVCSDMDRYVTSIYDELSIPSRGKFQGAA